MRGNSFNAFILATAGLLVANGAAQSAAETPRKTEFPLATAKGLNAHNVKVEEASHLGLAGVRVTTRDDVRERLVSMSAADRQRAAAQGETFDQFVMLEGLEFGDGVIEAEISGEAQTSVFEGARGFVGIAFRVQKDLRTYDAFYLRPTNGRATDQVRRNHSAQYVSHPEWPWARLRKEFPEKYESYVDLVPGEWTKIRIEVQGEQARLFVHGAAQPTLIVNDVRTGKDARGGIALWIDLGTVAHFRNVVVSR